MTEEHRDDCWNNINGKEMENPGLIYKKRDSYRPLSRVEAMEWLVANLVPAELTADFRALFALHQRKSGRSRKGR
jgi:hypothetical protein